MNQSRVAKTIFVASAFIGGCAPASKETTEPAAEATPAASSEIPTPPVAFGVVPIPADNPATPEKVALGRQLYYDTRLSADGSRACYTCHVCENGLTDGKAIGEGALSKPLTRSSPSLWNIAYHTELYWDGRSPSLEKQALAAWNGANMGASAEEVAPKIVASINAIEGYRSQFQKVFGADATPENMMQAIASYERTYLFCSDTAYDRWQAGDQSATSDAAKRGAELFVTKAGCGNCHSGSLFTDLKYHNVGIGLDKPEPDLGRHRVTKADADKGAFKTPSLRDINRSAPYFHNGSVATLKEAVDLMVSGGIDNPNIDRENLKPTNLNEEEKADLIEFLKALECPCPLEAPPLPQ